MVKSYLKFVAVGVMMSAVFMSGCSCKTKAPAETAEQKRARQAALVKAFGDVVAGMSTEDSEFVLFTLLRGARRKEPHGQGWSDIVAPGTNAIMFADIDVLGMMAIAQRVFAANFEGFTRGLLPNSAAGSPGSVDQ